MSLLQTPASRRAGLPVCLLCAHSIEYLRGKAAMGHSDCWDWMELLARTGSCPSEVAYLARKLHEIKQKEKNSSSLSHDENIAPPKQCTERKATSNSDFSLPSPLHVWAVTPTNCPEQDGLLPQLLLAYPEAPLQPTNNDERGWLPLHLTLARGGKSWSRVQPLLHAHPSALTCLLDGLPLFGWAALAPPSIPPVLCA